MMALCCDVSVLSIIGLILMFAGLASFLGGFASQNWMILQTSDGDTEISVGLWMVRNCTNSSRCVESPWHGDLVNGVFLVIKYVECVILCLCVGATFFHVIYIVYKSRCLAKTITICNLAIVLSLIATVVCWIINLPNGFYPSYSLGMIVLSAVFILISTSFLIKDLKSESYRVKRVSITPVTDTDTTKTETSFSKPSSLSKGTRMRSDPKRNAWSLLNDSDQVFSQASTSRQSFVIPEEYNSHSKKQSQHRAAEQMYQNSTPRKYGLATYIDDF